MTDTNSQPAQQKDNSQLVIILTYVLGIIGLIVAYFMTKENRSKVVAYHMRQLLGFIIAVIAVQIVFTIISSIFVAIGVGFLITLWGIVCLVAYIGILALWILGLIAGIKLEEKPMPVIGQIIQDKLAKVFA